jgi:hypothetical protein
MIPQWINIASGINATELPRIKTGVLSSTHFADVLWLLYTYTKGPESWQQRRQLRKKWWNNRKDIHYDIISSEDRKPRLMLNLFLCVQFVKVMFTKLEASNLFLYYNVYNEENYRLQINEFSTPAEAEESRVFVGETVI